MIHKPAYPLLTSWILHRGLDTKLSRLVIGHASGELGREARGEGGASQSPKIITRNLSPLAILGSQMSENVSSIIWPNTFIFTGKETDIQKEDLYRTFITIKIMILYNVSTMYIWHS